MIKRANKVLILALAWGLILAAGGAVAATQVEGKININTATVDQLRLLPGVGQVKAERIVKYRAKRKFRKPGDLRRVKGIGGRTLKKLKPWLVVSGPTTLKRLK